MSIESYSVGNRIYRGGSSAATRGTVDPMGYIDRESNKRSGLASAALRRMRGAPTGQGDVRIPQPTGIQFNQGGPSNQGPATSQLGQSGVPGQLQPAPLGMNRPLVTTTMTGQIVPAAQTNTAMPYDPEFADQSQDLLANYQQGASGLARNKQDLEREYTLGRRETENQLPEQLRALLNNYAGRGLAFSSGYGTGVGNVQADTAERLASLESGRARGMGELLENEGYLQSNYQRQLNALMAAATRRLSNRAGSLGLSGAAGTSAGKPKSPVGAPKGKGKAPAGNVKWTKIQTAAKKRTEKK